MLFTLLLILVSRYAYVGRSYTLNHFGQGNGYPRNFITLWNGLCISCTVSKDYSNSWKETSRPPVSRCNIFTNYNLGQNICILFHALEKVYFITSETRPDYFHQRMNVRVASRVAEDIFTDGRAWVPRELSPMGGSERPHNSNWWPVPSRPTEGQILTVVLY